MRFLRFLPNLLTLSNLFFGILALQYVFSLNYPMALWMIGLSLLCDFLDGMAARALRVDSPLGLQLDSLADMVSFGVVPGLVLYQLIEQYTPLEGIRHYILPYFGLLLSLASAMRLARFNLDEEQKYHFVGLATPSAAIFVMGLPELINYIGLHYSNIHVDWAFVLVVTALILSYLLNASIPLFALKLRKGDAHLVLKIIFLVLSLGLLIIFKINALSLIIALYILLSVLFFKPTKSISNELHS